MAIPDPPLLLTGANAIKINSPDSTTIEIIAVGDGAQGTRINIKSDFTTDGSPPTLPVPVGSGYTIGEVQRYQVVAPRKISIGGVPARPYTLKAIVEATNVANVADTADREIHIDFNASPDHITGVIPSVVVRGIRKSIPPTSGPVITLDGPRTISTYTYIAEIQVSDPISFQVLAQLAGPPGSLGRGNVNTATSLESDPPPTLPSQGPPFEGELPVNGDVEVYPITTGRGFRQGFVARKLYAKVRITDDENLNVVHEAHMEFNIVAQDTVTTLDVLVLRNREVFVLETLPVVDGAYEIDVGDAEFIEVLLRPTGQIGTQVIIRGLISGQFDPAPGLLSITDSVTFDADGRPFFVNEEGFIGIFGIDKKAALVEIQPGGVFRASTDGLIHVIADATSAVNLGNTLQKSFDLRVKVPTTLTDIDFYYVNSRNPDDVLPIEAGTDVNGPITGTGTVSDPFLINVDKPEQFEAFGTPIQDTDTGLSWVQTGYAYRGDLVDILYPLLPGDWKRAFTRLQRVNVLPNPASPGTPGLRPSTGAELIVASGGVLAGDPGPNPGVSKNICLFVRAQSVTNVDNFVEKTIYIQIIDPAVLGP